MKRHVENKKVKNKKKDNKERWLLTYADLITLLMAFFVVLYALSSINVKKFQAIALSLSLAMGGGESVLTESGVSLAPGISGSNFLNDELTTGELQELTDLERIRQELQSYIEQNGLTGKVAVNMEERGVVVSFQEVALFPLGSAELTRDARETIGKIGLILTKTSQYIRVEGHTDNLPINTSVYPSNWELSVARATSVVQELIHSLDFPPYRLSATGYSEFRPRTPNDSEAQRQQNRRVDIVILKSKYETAEPGSQILPSNSNNILP
jgi:chemotaxis protein MotB